MDNRILNDSSSSAVKKIKERNMLKKQRLAVIFMVLTIALLVLGLLLALYFVDIYSFEDIDQSRYDIKKDNGVYALYRKGGEKCYMTDEGYYQTDLGTLVQINPSTGEAKIYAVVDTEGTEVVGYSQYVLMFKQLTYDASSTSDPSRVIRSIEIHNQESSYTFERSEGNRFIIKEHPAAPIDDETFARIAVACGYTLAMRRLEAPKKLPGGEIDFSVYGLAEEKRTRTVTENGRESTEEYDYTPSYYIITTMTGESHKVILGDKIVTGSGYYARYEGRDTIYILGSSGLGDAVLQRLENIVTPSIVYPMTQTTYFNVNDFTVYNNIDYTSIYQAIVDRYGELTDEEYDEKNEEILKYYDELFEKHSNRACCFSYIPLTEREGSMYAYLPYTSALEYADGYYINSNNVDVVLSAIYQPDYTEVVKIAPSDEDLAEYGLENSPYVISYYFRTQDEEGKTAYIYNSINASSKSDDGTFYVYTPLYDMIVGISESSFAFLEWEEIAWYDQSYMQLDLSHVSEIKIESPEYSVDFVIDDSASKYMTFLSQSGVGFKEGDITYNIAKDSVSGKYVLKKESDTLKPVYDGDYLIAPLAFTGGIAESENYLFAESQGIDQNGDGNEDYYAYYYYNVVYSGGRYALAAYVALADTQGNKLSEDNFLCNVSFSTEFFLTNSNYIYLAPKISHIGKELAEKYESVGRGSFGEGDFYVTEKGQYVFVDRASGKWSIINDISCGIYFGDEDQSRLASRAVEVPAKYNSAGAVIRHPETYYPTTEEKLQYNEETGKIEVYNTARKVWENATYGDCTIGVWCSGAYYVTENNNIIVVNEETGDWGVAAVCDNEVYVADIIADGRLLDYVIKTTNHAGRIQNSTATDNFKQFYGALLYASLEGMAELTEEEKAELRALDDFSSSTLENNPCQLKITIYGCDLMGNRRDLVYRIYQYTERKSYITIELLNDPSDPSSSTEAYGNFYILRSFADKIIEDAKKIVNAEEVTSVTKY